jgi:hypothetical protein
VGLVFGIALAGRHRARRHGAIHDRHTHTHRHTYTHTTIQHTHLYTSNTYNKNHLVLRVGRDVAPAEQAGAEIYYTNTHTHISSPTCPLSLHTYTCPFSLPLSTYIYNIYIPTNQPPPTYTPRAPCPAGRSPGRTSTVGILPRRSPVAA